MEETKSERFLKLKAKGFNKLGKYERAEYKSLKAEIEGGVKATGKVATVAPPANEPVLQMTKAQLDEAIANGVANEMRKIGEANREASKSIIPAKGGWKEYKGEKKQIHTATIRKYRKDSDSPWALIVDWKHHKWDIDELTRRRDKDIYKLKLLYFEDGEDQGKEEEIEMPLFDFANIEDYEEVRILDADKKVFVQVQGHTQKSATDRSGYMTPGIKTGEEVELRVTREEYKCKIEVVSNGYIIEDYSQERLNG